MNRLRKAMAVKLLQGFASALEARDWRALEVRLQLLAVVSPRHAEKILDVIDSIAAENGMPHECRRRVIR